MRKRISKALAVVLAVALSITNVNVTSFAAETSGTENIKEQENTATGSAVSGNQSKQEKLQERIDALPTVSEFKAMTGTAVKGSNFNQKQMEVYDEAQDISDELDKLSDEEQAQIDTTKLEDLFEYFSGGGGAKC